jgi:DNA modification methylase
MEGKYDKRNKLNDLTGKDWLKLSGSFWMSEKCKEDKPAMNHPAPFMVKDIIKLISFFTKKGDIVLDPFVGSGTTLLASAELKRKGIGIDLSKEYKKLAIKRLSDSNLIERKDFVYILGDSEKEIEKLSEIDYIVTSPPYHNILKNKGAGLRAKKTNGYRAGARQGVEYYSEKGNDLGNKESYSEFLNY